MNISDHVSEYTWLFANIDHPMWICEKNTLRFLDVNDLGLEHYGYSRDEFLKMSFKDLITAEEAEKFLEFILKQNQPLIHSGIWKQNKKNNSIIEVEITGRDIEFNGVKAMLVMAEDVTNQKNIKRRLSAQFKVTRILAESKNLFDASTNILKAICESVDWQIGELWMADYDVNLLHLEGSWFKSGVDAEEFLEVSKKCKFGPGVSLQGRVWESGKPLWSGRLIDDQFFPRTTLIGKLKLNSALAFPIESRKKIIGVMAFYKDDIAEPDDELLILLDSLGKQIGDFIERKQNEPALQESEGLYKTLVEISPDAITYTDLSGKILFCNQQAAELFGYKFVEEFIGQNIYAFTAPEDQNNAIKNENITIDLGSTKNIEYTLIKKDGARFTAEVNTSIVHDASGKPNAFIGVIRNITKRKQTEEELKIRINQQAVIADFGQYVLAGNDIPKLMSKAAEVVAETLCVEFCEILELLPDNKSLLLTAGYGWKKGMVGKTILDLGKESHAGYTLLSNEPVIVEKYQYEKRFRGSKLLKDHKIVSGITVVIKGENSPFGILGAHNSKPRIFSKNDSHFLQAVANILSMGVERKNIEQELAQSLKMSKQVQIQAEESKKQLEFLTEASRILNSSLDYYKTLSTVADLAVRSIADWCMVDIIEKDEVQRHAIISNVDPEKIELFNEFQKKFQVDFISPFGIQKVVATGRSELIPQVSESILFSFIKNTEQLKIVRNFDFKSILIVPLKIRNHVLGAISLVSTKSGFNYSKSDINFMEDLARQASSSIENSRLYYESNLLNEKLYMKANVRTEELEISNTELEVEIKLRKKVIEELKELELQQSAITELGKKSLTESNLIMFMQEVVSIVPRILRIEFCGIFELVNEKKSLILRAAIGWKHTEVGSMEIKIKPDFQEGYIISNKELLFIENYFPNNKIEFNEALADNEIKSGLSLLISKDSQPFGVLSIYTSQDKKFSQDEIKFAQIISNLISNVLEKKEWEEKYLVLLNKIENNF